VRVGQSQKLTVADDEKLSVELALLGDVLLLAFVGMAETSFGCGDLQWWVLVENGGGWGASGERELVRADRILGC
jgi:hypothetical protein